MLAQGPRAASRDHSVGLKVGGLRWFSRDMRRGPRETCESALRGRDVIERLSLVARASDHWCELTWWFVQRRPVRPGVVRGPPQVYSTSLVPHLRLRPSEGGTPHADPPARRDGPDNRGRRPGALASNPADNPVMWAPLVLTQSYSVASLNSRPPLLNNPKVLLAYIVQCRRSMLRAASAGVRDVAPSDREPLLGGYVVPRDA
jgi:hypothetical protein